MPGMKRLLALLAVLLLGAGLAACGDDDDGGAVASDDETTTTTAAADESTTTTEAEVTTTVPADGGDATCETAAVSIANTSIGEVLVDADGMTLYMFKPDTQDASACTEGCAQAWPPLTGTGEAGDGVDAALLGTATRADGSTQVTYNGHRLYRYSGDKAAGDTNGHGVGDVWYALTASGEPPA
jgi:predicted lipoprotein with Yx(FWY)xxD motif